jgi:hypothetical protein
VGGFRGSPYLERGFQGGKESGTLAEVRNMGLGDYDTSGLHRSGGARSNEQNLSLPEGKQIHIWALRCREIAFKPINLALKPLIIRYVMLFNAITWVCYTVYDTMMLFYYAHVHYAVVGGTCVYLGGFGGYCIGGKWV